MGVYIIPIDLFGNGMVCYEQAEKINGEESDSETNGEEDNLNDKGELSDAVLSFRNWPRTPFTHLERSLVESSMGEQPS